MFESLSDKILSIVDKPIGGYIAIVFSLLVLFAILFIYIEILNRVLIIFIYLSHNIYYVINLHRILAFH